MATVNVVSKQPVGQAGGNAAAKTHVLHDLPSVADVTTVRCSRSRC